MILGIGTAHRACSLALVEGGEVIACVHEVIGRGHAERLMPMLAEILAGRQPAEIIVEVGPGSFTGIRIGLAAARALALAWQVPVRGISSCLLTAARALAEGTPAPLAAVLDGGRGEVFVQTYDADLREIAPLGAVPAAAIDFRGIRGAAGTGLPLIGLPAGIAAGPETAPNLADLPLIGSLQHHLLPPAPIYVRAPDAKAPDR